MPWQVGLDVSVVKTLNANLVPLIYALDAEIVNSADIQVIRDICMTPHRVPRLRLIYLCSRQDLQKKGVLRFEKILSIISELSFWDTAHSCFWHHIYCCFCHNDPVGPGGRP